MARPGLQDLLAQAPSQGESVFTTAFGYAVTYFIDYGWMKYTGEGFPDEVYWSIVITIAVGLMRVMGRKVKVEVPSAEEPKK